MISMLYVAMRSEQDVAREYEEERAEARDYEREFGVPYGDTSWTPREKVFVTVASAGIVALMLAGCLLS